MIQSHMVIFRGLERLGVTVAFGNSAGQYIVTSVLTLTGAVVFSTFFKKIRYEVS